MFVNIWSQGSHKNWEGNKDLRSKTWEQKPRKGTEEPGGAGPLPGTAREFLGPGSGVTEAGKMKIWMRRAHAPSFRSWLQRVLL